jgi:AraC-like DNA-binding protein
MSGANEARPIEWFEPPYDQPASHARFLGNPSAVRGGDVLLWFTERSAQLRREARVLSARTPGALLFLVLPAPETLLARTEIIDLLVSTDPDAVLPAMARVSPSLIVRLLKRVPGDPATALVQYLDQRQVLDHERARGEVIQIVRLSGELTTVSKVARRMCLSRRTLGRHLADAGLPSPSHWLQFARLFRAVLLIQGKGATVTRAAASIGYPDAFTLSNQMKRLLGLRPSHAKRRLGWRWLVEAWLAAEIARGGLDAARHAALLSRPPRNANIQLVQRESVRGNSHVGR